MVLLTGATIPWLSLPKPVFSLQPIAFNILKPLFSGFNEPVLVDAECKRTESVEAPKSKWIIAAKYFQTRNWRGFATRISVWSVWIIWLASLSSSALCCTIMILSGRRTILNNRLKKSLLINFIEFYLIQTKLLFDWLHCLTMIFATFMRRHFLSLNSCIHFSVQNSWFAIRTCVWAFVNVNFKLVRTNRQITMMLQSGCLFSLKTSLKSYK